MMLYTESSLDVKGALIEASAGERERPTSAYLSAPQSLAPSPTIATVRAYPYNISISYVF
jgi:hypothetical protein